MVTKVIEIKRFQALLCRKKSMQYNLSFVEIVFRYAIIMVLGILFGVTQFYPLIALAVAVFISAVSGFCPIYMLLGINHAPKE